MLPSILTGLVFMGTSSPVFTWFSPWFSPSNSEVSCKCSLKYVYYISHENVPFNQSHEMRIFPFFLLLLQPLQPPRPLQATLGGLLRRRRGQRETRATRVACAAVPTEKPFRTWLGSGKSAGNGMDFTLI